MRHRLVGAAEEVGLAVIDQLAAGDLALALGQHDQRPEDHQQRDLVARQAHVAGGVFAAGAEHRLGKLGFERDADVGGVGVVEQTQADIGQTAVELEAEGLVDQRAPHQLVVARQPALREQTGGEGLEFVVHGEIRLPARDLRWPMAGYAGGLRPA